MDIYRIKKVDGRYIQEETIDIQSLELLRADCQNTMDGLLAQMQKDIEDKNREISYLQTKIDKINDLLK